MAQLRSHSIRTLLLLSPVLSSVMLGSCAAAPDSYSVSETAAAPDVVAAGDQVEGLVAQKAQAPTDAVANVAEPQPPRQLPQLIKRAEMVLKVEAVTEAVQAVSKVVKTHQGDVLSMQDSLPSNPAQRQEATLQLRVPQAKLDQALADLAELGEVQSRALTAEDVSNQLVDLQARLKNLRSSEDRVRTIMDRSGSVADVLKVSQELSNIRASIEQIDAQLQRLKNQVAFSTIDLRLQDAIASNTRQPALGDQMQDSWTHATRAVGSLTVGLLSLGLWLLAFSPYFVGLLLLGWFVKRTITRKGISPTKPALSSAEESIDANHPSP